MKERRPPTDVVTDGEGGTEEELIDLTEALTVRSKRTERRRKKIEKKVQKKASFEPRGLLDLPYEMWMAILEVCLPRDILTLTQTSKPVRHFILEYEQKIANSVIARRYSALAKCLQRPVLIQDVPLHLHEALRDPIRESMLMFKKKPFQHIQAPDISVVCTCLTCVARWQALCVAVDFAHWQKNLDAGEPITLVPRGGDPKWNRELLAKNTGVVLKALSSPLWYARILAAHLNSTTRSIRRHGENKGNKRRRFRMTDEDIRSGTDFFLERSGPPTVSIPAIRDEYYMLEAFLPGRSWIADHNEWWYLPDSGHDKDVQVVPQWVNFMKARQENERRLRERPAAAVRS